MSTKEDIQKSFRDRNETIHDENKTSKKKALKFLELVRNQETEKLKTHTWSVSKDGKTMVLKPNPKNKK